MSINNEEEEGSWSNLHVELLDLIMRRLSFFDQLSLRAVCKSWRSINRGPNQMPWLMRVGDIDKYSWRSCRVIDPTTNKAYTINMSSIRKRKKKVESIYVHESKYGWLMISTDYRNLFYGTSRSLYLFTPFRKHNNLIELPTPKYFEFATFSTDPDRKDCLFLTIDRATKTKKENSFSIKTCRRGDKSWSTQNIKCDITVTMIQAWMYSEGILYYTDGKRVRGLDISQQTPGTHHVLSKIPNLAVNGSGCICVDMVKLDGVLFVLLRGSFSVRNFHRLYGIDIRLDSSLMTWKEIVYEYSFSSLTDNINPKIILALGKGGYRSFLKFSEDRQVEIMYDCSRAFLRDNSPVLHISVGCVVTPLNTYWIDHPLACS